MDPVTITVTLLSTITLANNLYTTITRLSKSATSNNRLKTQRIAFRIEIVTLQEWLKNCAISGSPLEGNTEIEELLGEFKKQAASVKTKLDKYTFDTFRPREIVSNQRAFTSRLKYESGGYEELNEMIILLEKLNKALQTIAPPLPPGYDYASTERRNATQAFATSAGCPPDPMVSGALSGGSRTSVLSAPDDLDAQDNHQDVCSLWNACCGAFTIISEYAGSNHMVAEKCRDRLRLWGLGLFESGELHLDALLGASKSLQEKLLEPLAARFIEIALQQRMFTRCRCM